MGVASLSRPSRAARRQDDRRGASGIVLSSRGGRVAGLVIDAERKRSAMTRAAACDVGASEEALGLALLACEGNMGRHGASRGDVEACSPDDLDVRKRASGSPREVHHVKSCM